jgi:simple sugar transport system permease protein
MAGQLGLIWAVDWNISGVWGLGFGVLIGLPIAIGLGIVCGSVLNRAKGREMATGYILGFFMDGVYQFVVLYLMGAIIPMRSAALTLSRGYGVRNTVNLDSVRQSLDKLLMVKAFGLNFPIATYLVIALLCVFIIWFRKTKLGQDMRAIGQDQPVSNASGIPVEKTRIIAIVMSTVLAMIGQIIFLQNMGNMATYNAHRQTGFFAAAAILVGGASVTKATIPNVFVGVVLLHLMYIVMPRAGAQLFGSAQIGEYFRDAFSYGAIALALVLHAWRRFVVRAAIVAVYLALSVFVFLNGRGHTLLIDNKTLPDGGAQAFRRVKVFIDGQDPLEMYARDRELVKLTGQTHRVRIETQEGATRLEASFRIDLKTDMVLLSIPKMAAGADDFWEPFVVVYEKQSRDEELPSLDDPVLLEPTL